MNKRLIIIFLILFGSVATFAQAVSTAAQLEKYSAPVKWELYRVSPKKVSLLFPKIPVVNSSLLICSQLETQSYFVYADNVVYGLSIYSKLDEKVPESCPEKNGFDEKSFKSRVTELLALNKTAESVRTKINGFNAEFIKGNNNNYWLINDYKNLQWFELMIVNSDENKKESKDFINSLNINKNIRGIEIESGVESTLGDIIIKDVEVKSTDKIDDASKVGNTGIRFVSKPQPKYTDSARKNNIQGQVVLRITFLANGGVGSISPVRGLDYGLTEQAIIASKKLVFIPAKRNGKNVSITMSVQYTFKIY